MDLYDIPVIQPDLRHEETIIQIFNSFDILQQVLTEVFDKIDHRILRNSDAIKAIDSRIEKVNKKIDELSNDYESIEIQSPSDYPPDKLFNHIPMTFMLSNRKEIISKDYQVRSGPDSNISKTYDKKLQFYYVRQSKKSRSSSSSISSKDVHAYLESGLGPIPSYVNSINALLLFNSSENVFDKKTQRNLRRSEQSAVRHYDPVLSDGNGLVEKAPASITNRQLLNLRIKKSLFMSTQWNDDEQIDIPITLPDVGGIRDKNKKNAKIAKTHEEKEMKKSSEEPKLLQPKSVPEDVSSKIEVRNIVNSTVLENSSSVVDSAPTPPPVPPPMTTKELTPKIPPPKLNSNTQDRSSLMEAIRQAGGAQKMKKKVNDEPAESREKNEKEKKPVTFSSGSLMDDLHKKLALRRKGISGTKDLSQGANVMDGISAMIPPPPPKQSDTSSESESNDDWN